MKRSIRFSTLLRDYGPLVNARHLTEAEWKRVVVDAEFHQHGRFMTVYHGESNWCEPLIGLVNRHGFVNAIGKYVFSKPLPPEITEVHGMRDSQAAWLLVNEGQCPGNPPTIELRRQNKFPFFDNENRPQARARLG